MIRSIGERTAALEMWIALYELGFDVGEEIVDAEIALYS